MPGHDHIFSRIADGDIEISTVVELSDSFDYAVKQSAGAAMPFGIAQEWIQGAPGTPFADSPGNIAATDKRAISIYGPGAICPAAQKANSPALAAGVSVKSDSDGHIVLAAATDMAVGWVNESGDATADAHLRVFVWPHISSSAGAQGATGTQGFQGGQGYQGAQGFQGKQGFQGAQGFQG